MSLFLPTEGNGYIYRILMVSVMEHMIRRSRLERYRDILRVIANFGPIRQTHIMYKANLTWEGLKQDLTKLKSTGMLQEATHEEGIFFTITQSGLDVLSHFSTIESNLDLRAPVQTIFPRSNSQPFAF